MRKRPGTPRTRRARRSLCRSFAGCSASRLDWSYLAAIRESSQSEASPQAAHFRPKPRSACEGGAGTARDTCEDALGFVQPS